MPQLNGSRFNGPRLRRRTMALHTVAIAAIILAIIGIWSAIVYVVVHFIVKFW
jgi:hypothetical protein